MGMEDYAFGIKMRDTISRIAEEVVTRLRPPDRYGQVVSIDTVNRKASVVLNGDVDPVTVNLGSIWPTAAGQWVRVAGVAGDKKVVDVLGGTVGTNILRLVSQGDVSPTSTDHGLQIGPDTGVNLIIDNNEIMARNNGVVNTLNLNLEGAGVNVGGNTGVDDVTDEVRVGRSAGYRTILNYNQLRALLNSVASTLYFNYSGGDVNICGNSTTAGIVSPGVMRCKQNISSTNETAYTSTTPTLGTTTCGFSFVAPPSGIVLIEVAAYVVTTTTNAVGRVWGEIRSGGTVGGGTIQGSTHGNGDNGPLLFAEAQNGTANVMSGSGYTLVSGLTPGTTYNASVWYALSSTGTGYSMAVNAKRITLIPSM